MSTAAYRIRRSTRARRVRVSVDPDGTVTVTLPSRAPERLAAEAVQELAPWIARRRKALARAAEDRARPEGTVPYLGEHLTLVPPARPHARAPPRRPAVRPGRRPEARDRALLPPGRPRGDRRAARRGDRARRHDVPRADDPRAAHALGVVLVRRRDVVQLAAAARAARDRRLRGRARGLPPRGDGPLAALLGAARVPRARLAPPRHPGCAATAPRSSSDRLCRR